MTPPQLKDQSVLFVYSMFHKNPTNRRQKASQHTCHLNWTTHLLFLAVSASQFVDLCEKKAIPDTT